MHMLNEQLQIGGMGEIYVIWETQQIAILVSNQRVWPGLHQKRTAAHCTVLLQVWPRRRDGAKGPFSSQFLASPGTEALAALPGDPLQPTYFVLVGVAKEDEECFGMLQNSGSDHSSQLQLLQPA